MRDFETALAQERRDDLAVARAFSAACASGDVADFMEAVDYLNSRTVDGWRYAMLRVARLQAVSPEIRAAFLGVWIESKMLPLKVGDRRALAQALRVLMPSSYSGPALKLYRGAGARERRCRLYGFSWTTNLEIARDKFAAERRVRTGGSVVLETTAPSEAILLVREDENYYDEGEVVVDPFKLSRVRVVERLPEQPPSWKRA